MWRLLDCGSFSAFLFLWGLYLLSLLDLHFLLPAIFFANFLRSRWWELAVFLPLPVVHWNSYLVKQEVALHRKLKAIIAPATMPATAMPCTTFITASLSTCCLLVHIYCIVVCFWFLWYAPQICSQILGVVQTSGCVWLHPGHMFSHPTTISCTPG